MTGPASTSTFALTLALLLAALVWYFAVVVEPTPPPEVTARPHDQLTNIDTYQWGESKEWN